MSLDGPAILFVDLDGTVRKGKGELGYFVNRPDDVEVFPEATTQMRRWREAGGVVVGVTNQGGIGLGYMDTEINWMIEQRTISAAGGHIDVIKTCPHAPKDGCFCRKPLPGLIYYGAAWVAFNRGEPCTERCVMVGDMETDKQAAEAAGIKFMWASEWRAQAPNQSNPTNYGLGSKKSD